MAFHWLLEAFGGVFQAIFIYFHGFQVSFRAFLRRFRGLYMALGPCDLQHLASLLAACGPAGGCLENQACDHGQLHLLRLGWLLKHVFRALEGLETLAFSMFFMDFSSIFDVFWIISDENKA